MPPRRTTPGPQGGAVGYQPPKLPFRFMPRETSDLLHFEKGMDQSQESTVLPNGLLVDCINWVPEVLGGLRCKIGWTPYTVSVNAASLTNGLGQVSAGFPANRKIRAIYYASGMNLADVTQFPSRNMYVIGLTNPSNSDRLEFWAVDAGLGAANLNFIQWMTVPSLADIDFSPPIIAKTGGLVMYAQYKDAGGVNPGLNVWNGTLPANPTAVTNSPPARTIISHGGRVFAGGSDPVNPNWEASTLYYSNAGTALAGWAGAGSPPPGTNWIRVGVDDGDPIEDLADFQGQLMIAKRSSIWILTGTDATTFALTRLDGCYGGRGRILVPTPSGLVILGSDRAWMWNGGDPKVISDGIVTYYNEAGTTWRNGVYVAGKVFVTGFASRKMLVFDVDTKAWHAETLSVGATTDEMDAIGSDFNRIVGGPVNSTLYPFASRSILAGGARSADTALSPASIFHAQTPDYWFGTSREKFTIRHVWIRLRQRSGNAGSNGLVITPVRDGVDVTADQKTIPAQATPGVFSYCMYLGADGAGHGYTCFSLGFKFDVTPSATPALFDIEEVFPDILPLPERRAGVKS